MENVVSFVPRNPRANQAGFAWQGSKITFGGGVHLHGIKPDGAPYGSWWQSDDAVVIGKENVNFAHSETSHALAEVAALVTPSIPDIGWSI